VLTPVLFKLRFLLRDPWCRPGMGMCCRIRTGGAVFAFQSAWIAVFTGLLYVIVGLLSDIS